MVQRHKASLPDTKHSLRTKHDVAGVGTQRDRPAHPRWRWLSHWRTWRVLKSTVAAPLLLIALVLVVYGRTATFDFLSWDDGYHVTQNPWLNPPSAAGLAHLWQKPYFGLYAPVVYTAFAAESLISGWISGANQPEPWVFHLGSVLLHAANVLLVYQLARRLIGLIWPAAAGAALFAAHPLQVEAVAWVSDTRGLLSALFGLFAVQLVLPIHRDNSVGRRRRWFTMLRYAAATACYLAALCSKPTVAVVPLVVLVVVWAWRAALAGSGSLRMASRIAWFSLLVVWLGVGLALAVGTSRLQHHDTLSAPLAWYARPAAAMASTGFYLGKLCVPLGLAPDYGWRTPIMATASWRYAWCLAPALVASMLVIFRRRFDRRWWALATVVLVAVAPTIGLVPSAFQAISFVADRYFYLAMLGPAIGLGMWLATREGARAEPSTHDDRVATRTLTRQQRRRLANQPMPAARASWRWPAALAGIASCSVLSFVQCAHWRNDVTVAARMLDVNRSSFVALTQRGHAAARRGDVATAADNYRRALAVNPDYPLAWFNWGVLHLQQRKWNTAVRNFERALALDPTDVMTATNLGRALIETRSYQRAVIVLEGAVAREPDCALAQATLGDAYLQRREFDQARQCLKSAIKLQPNLGDAWYLLGCVEREQQHADAAHRAWIMAIGHEPRLSAAHYGLGELAFERRDWPAALRYFSEALELQPNFLQARFQLARVLVEQDQIATAAAAFEQLISAHPRYVDPYLGLADVRLRQGRPAEAQSLCQVALELRPGWPPATEVLARAQAAALR
ncbi:MAG: tetratricopeptide repeat protein [Pirellulales bacterium]|nr:tetratricopeptide repeat protein [Pirellulales bacterium]